MKLVTIHDTPQGSPGAILRDGSILNITRAAREGTIETWIPDSVIGILRGGPGARKHIASLIAHIESLGHSERESLASSGVVLPQDTRLLPPIPHPSLVLAVGLAYKSHLAEMSGTPTPKKPTAFLKAPSSISGPDEKIELPPDANDMVDYEGELACVFGSTCHRVAPKEALSHIAGFCAANDFSARNWVQDVWSATQPWEARQTWEVNIMGKQMPGFTALGPSLTTLDEITDLGALTLSTTINGKVMQNSKLSDMIFPIEEVISYFSQWYTFRPGDVLLTGTPAGVGVGRDPRVFVKKGDTVEVSIEKIGALRSQF